MMFRLRKTIVAFVLCVIGVNGWVLSSARSALASNDALGAAVLSREELENHIKLQNAELEKLNQQLTETQRKLEGARNESVGLQKELETVRTSITRLNLNIKADKISIQKLTLEIESLGYDIRDIEIMTEGKKESVVEVLRKIQMNDQVNLLTILLKGNSLADSVFEAKALADTGSQLGIEVDRLETLRKQKIDKVNAVNDKKTEIVSRQKNLENQKVIIQDQEGEKETLLAQSKNKEGLYEKELDELRKKQDEIAVQISKFEDELRVKFDVGLLPSKRSGVFEWPLKLKKDGGVGIITQHLGEVSKLYRGKPHNGLDIAAPVGTPVFAADDGKVIAVDNNDINRWRKYQYGKYILIEHENNLATLYAHLSKQSVRVGEAVKRGELIGYSGNTGYSTGAHLHFGVYWGPSLLMKSVPPAAGLVPVGVVVNPEDYL